MGNNILLIFLATIIFIVVYLILREVNCWYWKINEKISLQKEQNELLKKILNLVTKSSNTGKDYTIISNEGIVTGAELKSERIVLTDLEQKQVDAFIKFGIKPGDKLVINKFSRKIDRFDEQEWKNADQSEWEIIKKV